MGVDLFFLSGNQKKFMGAIKKRKKIKVSVLLSASVERFSVSRIRDFYAWSLTSNLLQSARQQGSRVIWSAVRLS